MRKAVILFVTLALLAVISVAPAYAAAPQLPHAFCGNVLINGDPALDGTLVSATVSSGTAITNSQNPVATVGGNYGIDGLPLLVQGDDIPNGAIITFYVNGVEVEGVTATFEVGGGPTQRDLSVTIPAIIGYSPSSFSFTATQGGADPPTQTLSISNTDIDPTAMDWSVTSDAIWLSLSPTSGSSSGEVDSVTVSVSISGMSAGSYGGTITISALAATNTPQTVAVSLTIAAPTPPPAGGGGPAGDTAPPVISNVGSCFAGVTETTADICWTTNELSTSQVEYWTSPSILSPLDETMVIDHHVQLTGLTPGTTYHYKTMSRDAADNLAVSEEYTFTTLETPAAAFSISNLTIQPAEVQPGEVVTVAVSVANTGGTEGSYTLVLKINGVKEAGLSVTIAAGGSAPFTFSVTKEDAGSYSVTVDGLSGSFTVEPPLPPPPPPAAFSVSNLSIQPAEVQPGEAVTIDVAVTNTGGTEGSYTAVLKINGVKEADRTVTIAAGDTLNLIFPVTKEAAGSYSVTVDGLSGSFTVVAPAVVINWPLFGGIIGGVIVLGLLLFFLVFRRRAY